VSVTSSDQPEPTDSEENGSGTSHPSSLIDSVSSILRSIVVTIQESADLLALEGELAIRSLIQIFLLSIVISITALSIWTKLQIALVLMLNRSGIPVEASVSILAVLNLLATYFEWLKIKSLCQRLLFKTSREQIFVKRDRLGES